MFVGDGFLNVAVGEAIGPQLEVVLLDYCSVCKRMGGRASGSARELALGFSSYGLVISEIEAVSVRDSRCNSSEEGGFSSQEPATELTSIVRSLLVFSSFNDLM